MLAGKLAVDNIFLVFFHSCKSPKTVVVSSFKLKLSTNITTISYTGGKLKWQNVSKSVNFLCSTWNQFSTNLLLPRKLGYRKRWLLSEYSWQNVQEGFIPVWVYLQCFMDKWFGFFLNKKRASFWEIIPKAAFSFPWRVLEWDCMTSFLHDKFFFFNIIPYDSGERGWISVRIILIQNKSDHGLYIADDYYLITFKFSFSFSSFPFHCNCWIDCILTLWVVSKCNLDAQQQQTKTNNEMTSHYLLIALLCYTSIVMFVVYVYCCWAPR